MPKALVPFFELRFDRPQELLCGFRVAVEMFLDQSGVVLFVCVSNDRL